MADWYDASYYQQKVATDPTGPESGERKVLRGGSWDGFPEFVRVSVRVWDVPTVRIVYAGFRCAGDLR